MKNGRLEVCKAVLALSLVTNRIKTTTQATHSLPLSLLPPSHQKTMHQIIEYSPVNLLVCYGAYCPYIKPPFIYYLAIHLANSALWIAAYQDLHTLKPGCLIKLPVLDFFLSWTFYQSWDSDSSASCFYYLDTETIQRLTGDPSHDNILVHKCLDLNTQPIKHAPVIFLVTRQNTYFLALFDFLESKVLILGRNGDPTLDNVTIHAEWESWDGPILWEEIGRALTWLTSEINETRPMVVVYEANWIPV